MTQSEQDERRYGIAEVSSMTDVPSHVLRQWERRFRQLNPKRDRANRRYYQTADVEIVRRIKQLLRRDRMTAEGAQKQLALELAGEGRPKTRQDLIDLVDQMEVEVRSLLDLLDGKE